MPNDNPQQGGIRNDGSMGAEAADHANNHNHHSKRNHHNDAPPRGSKIPPTQKDARKLFVGGLPANVTEGEFRAFFEGFGVVMDSIVMIDRDTRRSRGFGFVTFADPNVARQLLEARVPDMDHVDGVGRIYMRSKLCEIKAAEPREAGYVHGGRKNPHRGGTTQPSQQQHRHHYQQHQQPPHKAWASSPDGINPGIPSSLPPYETLMMYPPANMYYPAHHQPAVLYGEPNGYAAPYAPVYYDMVEGTNTYGGPMMEGYAMDPQVAATTMPTTQPSPAVTMMTGGAVLPPQPPPVGLDGTSMDTTTNALSSASSTPNAATATIGPKQEESGDATGEHAH